MNAPITTKARIFLIKKFNETLKEYYKRIYKLKL